MLPSGMMKPLVDLQIRELERRWAWHAPAVEAGAEKKAQRVRPGRLWSWRPLRGHHPCPTCV